MCAFRVTISRRQRQELERQLHTAQHLGRLHDVTCLLAILAVTDGHSCDQVALTLRVTPKSVHQWVRRLLVEGLPGLKRKKPPGRPPKLTKTQKQELASLLEGGPVKAGFASACWRSPMIQQLIHERFGVYYNVFYIAQLLKNLGFSYQKAAFVSDHLNEAKRHAWCTTTWPQIVKLAKARDALLLFGDEASFPQWGTLSYTWARRGHQPMVKTSGKRKGYKVFGVIEYCTGRFWYQGQEGRLNSEAYTAFLTHVLAQVTQPIILIQDGAKYHTSAAMRRFFALHTERLTVFPLPSYSPDYNPIEKLWKKVKKEGTHLQYFPTFEALTDKVEHALLKFAKTPAEILALCSLPTELAKAA
jgi:transposase